MPVSRRTWVRQQVRRQRDEAEGDAAQIDADAGVDEAAEAATVSLWRSDASAERYADIPIYLRKASSVRHHPAITVSPSMRRKPPPFRSPSSA